MPIKFNMKLNAMLSQSHTTFTKQSALRYTMVGLTVLATCFISACSTPPSKKIAKKPQMTTPFVYQEPELSAPFYPLNAMDYSLPSRFEIALKQAATQPVQKKQVIDPANPNRSIILDSNKLIIPTTASNKRSIGYAVLAGENQLDVTYIDDFLQMVEGKARHYPPRFNNRQERRGFESKLKQVIQQLDQYAVTPNASFDILIRAYKANVMARNLDLGAIHTTKAYTYAERLLKMNPNDAEVNFWFGFTLSEGGGHKEAIPYLDKAMKAGVQEAYLSAANNYIALEQKKNAIQVLKNYANKYPDEASIAERLMLEIEQKGRWNVWQTLNTAATGN